MVSVKELITARGHPNISARHRSTFEVTKDPYVTPRGDCIIAVSASKAAADLSPEFKNLLKNSTTVVVFRLEVEDYTWIVRGYGSESMVLTDERSMVFRRSRYVCPRTVMIGADKSAVDLPREIVEALRKPDTPIQITLEAYRRDTSACE
ncbi:DUF371 domain-containing protein [Candidatus Bathyarchaeota archaeon]|nr:DUF371 domain-containing protein [Candidatus Bathyarchaeota archaeon]RJS74579.1 MAG: DUF371 domain-containing protein [Candidatus Bathyarchaeota archaeon]